MNKAAHGFSFEKAEDSTGFLLWQLTNLWQREIRKALEPFDITHSQFVLLASIHWLGMQRQDVTQILLSNHTKIDPMTTSTVLRTLEQKGLISRQEHSSDTRAKSVTMTESGARVTVEAVKAVEKFDSAFFSRLKGNLVTFNKNLLSLLSE